MVSSGKGSYSSPSIRQPSAGCSELRVKWTAVTNIFVRAGEAAGIAFQWTETPTAGLTVVGVADESIAARHGGITAGMQLVEVSRRRVAGMGQDDMMRVMQAVASQPRVLTLARIAPPPLTDCCSAKARPEDTTPGSTDRSITADFSSTLSSSAVVAETTGADVEANMPPPNSLCRPFLGRSPVSSRPHSDWSSSDGDASSVGGSNETTTSTSTSKTNFYKRTSAGLRQPLPQERTLALRFVGSRGNASLFDRNHVLGLKKRDIEFVPSGSRSRAHRTNSQRSLGELARDWRNDPFSTPARRRRLINDACKVIVNSYTQASVLRVAELRRQETFVVRIQAAARMWSSRRCFVVKLAKRRGTAALTLQLGWLSHTARQRVLWLRAERDHARRVDKAMRRKRLEREIQERRRCEEERERAEKEIAEREKQRHEQKFVVLIQRRFRALKAGANVHRAAVQFCFAAMRLEDCINYLSAVAQ